MYHTVIPNKNSNIFLTYLCFLFSFRYFLIKILKDLYFHQKDLIKKPQKVKKKFWQFETYFFLEKKKKTAECHFWNNYYNNIFYFTLIKFISYFIFWCKIFLLQSPLLAHIFSFPNGIPFIIYGFTWKFLCFDEFFNGTFTIFR